MDVRMLNITGYAPLSPGKTPEEFLMSGMGTSPEAQKHKTDVPEKVIMDLKDVQTFLYLMIGSHIRIDGNSSVPGQTVDTSA